MKFVTEKEALSWLEGCGLPTSHCADATDFFGEIPFPNLSAIRYTLPTDSGKKVALARAVFSRAKFQSNVLVWLRNWMVWPSCAHLPLVLRLRQAMGSERSLDETPCHLSEPSESDDAVSLLIVSLVCCWDCLVFDANQRLICFVSHDEYMILMSTDEMFLNEIGARFESAKWCQKLPLGTAAKEA
jgi:hypothetical protein